jgi:hypothetical protein
MVEFCQVDAKEDCTRHADCSVDEQFGGREIGCLAGVVDLIAAHCQAGTILLLLLWAKITADLVVRGLFVGGDLRCTY